MLWVEPDSEDNRREVQYVRRVSVCEVGGYEEYMRSNGLPDSFRVSKEKEGEMCWDRT